MESIHNSLFSWDSSTGTADPKVDFYALFGLPPPSRPVPWDLGVHVGEGSRSEPASSSDSASGSKKPQSVSDAKLHGAAAPSMQASAQRARHRPSRSINPPSPSLLPEPQERDQWPGWTFWSVSNERRPVTQRKVFTVTFASEEVYPALPGVRLMDLVRKPEATRTKVRGGTKPHPNLCRDITLRVYIRLFDYWKGRFDLSCMDTFGESRNPEAPAPLNTIAARVSEGIRGVMQNLKASVVPSDYHSPCEDPRCVGIPFSRLYLEAMHSRDMIDWTVQVYAAFPPGEGPCTNAPCPNEPSSRCLLYRWASSPDSESDV